MSNNNNTYKAYLLSKNRAEENNLKSYKKQYETATGQQTSTDENAKVEININDNMIDEEQVDTELLDLLKQYIPNIAYLTQVVGDDRLSNEMKYDLVLNFQTYVEPRILAIKNKKISIQRMVAFLAQMAKELKASSLNVDIDNKLTDITGALSSQIAEYKGKEGEASLDELKEDLIRFNQHFFKLNNLTRNSTVGKNINEIKKLIKDIAEIDRSYHNFYVSVKKVKPKFRNDGYKFMTDEIIANLKLSTVTRTDELRNVFANYYDQSLTQTGITYPEARMIWEHKRNIVEENELYLDEDIPDEQNVDEGDPFDDEEVENPLRRRREVPADELRRRMNIPANYVPSQDDLNEMNMKLDLSRDAKRRRARRLRNGTFQENLEKNMMDEEDRNITDAYVKNPKVLKQDLINAELRKEAGKYLQKRDQKREKVREALERYAMGRNDKNAIGAYNRRDIIEEESTPQKSTPQKSTLKGSPDDLFFTPQQFAPQREGYVPTPIRPEDIDLYPANVRAEILRNINKLKDYNSIKTPTITDKGRMSLALENLIDIRDKYEDEIQKPLDGEEDILGPKDGYGLRKKKTLKTHEQQLVGGKYFINRKKLSANVLEIRYTKNRHLIPIKSQIVGKSLRSIIEEIIDNNNLDKQKYEKLTKIEQNLLRSLLPYLGRDIDDVDDDEAFYDRFDVIRGELLAGNDNKMLKREAKQYLMHALNTGKISRTHFNQMLIDLDL